MNDRQTIVLVLATLTALVGLTVIVVAAISLQDPFTASGEIGTRTEISGELVAAAGFGLLLVISGIGVATRLVRAQLRRSRT